MSIQLLAVLNTAACDNATEERDPLTTSELESSETGRGGDTDTADSGGDASESSADSVADSETGSETGDDDNGGDEASDTTDESGCVPACTGTEYCDLETRVCIDDCLGRACGLSPELEVSCGTCEQNLFCGPSGQCRSPENVAFSEMTLEDVQPGTNLHGIVSFKDKLWLLGVDDKVWSSEQGQHWQPHDIELRSSWDHQFVVHGDYLWRYYRDSYVTQDGLHWAKRPEELPYFAHIGYFRVESLGDRMVVFGSSTGAQRGFQSWTSEHGREWTERKMLSATDVHGPFGSTVHRGTIWLVASLGTDPSPMEIWQTNDGENWQLISNDNGLPDLRSHFVVAAYDHFWVIGGRVGWGSGAPYNTEIWYSADGVQWQLSPTTGHDWDVKYHSATVHNGQIFISGHDPDGKWEDSKKFTVWRSELADVERR